MREYPLDILLHLNLTRFFNTRTQIVEETIHVSFKELKHNQHQKVFEEDDDYEDFLFGDKINLEEPQL